MAMSCGGLLYAAGAAPFTCGLTAGAAAVLGATCLIELTAYNLCVDKNRKADEEMSKQMQGLMGGLKIPGLF